MINALRLPDTLVYLNGLYFALRSGEDCRRLQYKPFQIKVVNMVGQAPHIIESVDFICRDSADMEYILIQKIL